MIDHIKINTKIVNKFSVFSFLLFSSLSIAATTNSVDKACSDVGKLFGPGGIELTDRKLSICYQWAYQEAKSNRKLFASSGDGKTQAFGFNNLIYIKNQKSTNIISGQMAGIGKIKHLTVSNDGQNIAVVDEKMNDDGKVNNRILYFKSSQNGNVVPLSINSESIINQIQSLSFTESNQQVVASINLQNNTSEVLIFDISQDSRSPLADKKPKSKNLISSSKAGLNLIKSTFVDEKFLILLDPAYGVKVFKRNDQHLKTVLDVPYNSNQLKNLKDLEHLSYNSSKKMLSVFDSLGTSSQLPLE
jgi:hypothetical protein